MSKEKLTAVQKRHLLEATQEGLRLDVLDVEDYKHILLVFMGATVRSALERAIEELKKKGVPDASPSHDTPGSHASPEDASARPPVTNPFPDLDPDAYKDDEPFTVTGRLAVGEPATPADRFVVGDVVKIKSDYALVVYVYDDGDFAAISRTGFWALGCKEHAEPTHFRMEISAIFEALKHAEEQEEAIRRMERADG